MVYPFQYAFHVMWVVWHSAKVVGHISKVTLGPVSTSMGDHLWAGKPSRYVTQPSTLRGMVK